MLFAKYPSSKKQKAGNHNRGSAFLIYKILETLISMIIIIYFTYKRKRAIIHYVT